MLTLQFINITKHTYLTLCLLSPGGTSSRPAPRWRDEPRVGKTTRQGVNDGAHLLTGFATPLCSSSRCVPQSPACPASRCKALVDDRFFTPHKLSRPHLTEQTPHQPTSRPLVFCLLVGNRLRHFRLPVSHFHGFCLLLYFLSWQFTPSNET